MFKSNNVSLSFNKKMENENRRFVTVDGYACDVSNYKKNIVSKLLETGKMFIFNMYQNNNVNFKYCFMSLDCETISYQMYTCIGENNFNIDEPKKDMFINYNDFNKFLDSLSKQILATLCYEDGEYQSNFNTLLEIGNNNSISIDSTNITMF